MGAPGDSSFDASIRVQRLGGSKQATLTSPTRPTAAAALPFDKPRGSSINKLTSQQAQRRQAALHQLAARSRSRSASSSRAVSKQPSRAELDQQQQQQQQQQQRLVDDVLTQDAAAVRLADDYLAAVHSAAFIHSASAAASSASSWPPQSDVPHWMSEPPGKAQGDQQRLDWEGMLRRGVELAHGPSTDQFLQVVDLFPEPGLGRVRTPCSLHEDCWQLLVEPHTMECNVKFCAYALVHAQELHILARAFSLALQSSDEYADLGCSYSIQECSYRSNLHNGVAYMPALQVSTVSSLKDGNSIQPHHSMCSSKQRGMAAELADILSQLDDAARLADELDFGVKSRSRQRG